LGRKWCWTFYAKLASLSTFGIVLLLTVSLTSCSSSTMKQIFVPPNVAVDSGGPNYFHNISRIKYWDRISQASRATNFAWWDSTGTVHEMYEYWNKVVILNFFGTWSAPAVSQLAVLDSIRSLGDTNYLIIAVAMREKQTEGNAIPPLDSFARAHSIPYQILVGSRDFGFTYGGIDVVPTTFVITRRRKISDTFEGYATTAQLKAAITKAESLP